MKHANDHAMTNEEIKELWPDVDELPTERAYGDGLYNCSGCGEISRDRQCHECWAKENN